MIHTRLSQAAKWCGVQYLGQDVSFHGVSLDSRATKPGELFIALKGLRHDGHDYIPQAQANGAVAVMVSRRVDTALPLLPTNDAVFSLGKLASAWRGNFILPVTGVLGSNGKTTVKELIAHILQTEAKSVLVTQGNQNNMLGLPLTLLRLSPSHQAAVLELGANKMNEIRVLAEIARPDIAVITNAGLDHMAGFGGREGAALANSEVFSAMTNKGMAILNHDDACLPIWRREIGSRTYLLFGFGPGAEVRGDWRQNKNGGQLRIESPWGKLETTLQLLGRHNALNAMAAAAACMVMGVTLDTIATGLTQARPISGRLKPYHGKGGASIIDDTYNANPSSLETALQVLAAQPGQKILVFGDMAEIGLQAADSHRDVGVSARQAGIDRLFTLGNMARHAARSFGVGAQSFDDYPTLIDALQPLLAPDVSVLIKGSRCMTMENILSGICSSNT